MKKEKILTLKIAKELLASFLSEKESLPPLPPFPQFGWRISGTAMPDLTPFTQIETDAIGLLREAIVNGVGL